MGLKSYTTSSQPQLVAEPSVELFTDRFMHYLRHTCDGPDLFAVPVHHVLLLEQDATHEAFRNFWTILRHRLDEYLTEKRAEVLSQQKYPDTRSGQKRRLIHEDQSFLYRYEVSSLSADSTLWQSSHWTTMYVSGPERPKRRSQPLGQVCQIRLLINPVLLSRQFKLSQQRRYISGNSQPIGVIRIVSVDISHYSIPALVSEVTNTLQTSAVAAQAPAAALSYFRIANDRLAAFVKDTVFNGGFIFASSDNSLMKQYLTCANLLWVVLEADIPKSDKIMACQDFIDGNFSFDFTPLPGSPIKQPLISIQSSEIGTSYERVEPQRELSRFAPTFSDTEPEPREVSVEPDSGFGSRVESEYESQDEVFADPNVGGKETEGESALSEQDDQQELPVGEVSTPELPTQLFREVEEVGTSSYDDLEMATKFQPTAQDDYSEQFEEVAISSYEQVSLSEAEEHAEDMLRSIDTASHSVIPTDVETEEPEMPEATTFVEDDSGDESKDSYEISDEQDEERVREQIRAITETIKALEDRERMIQTKDTLEEITPSPQPVQPRPAVLTDIRRTAIPHPATREDTPQLASADSEVDPELLSALMLQASQGYAQIHAGTHSISSTTDSEEDNFVADLPPSSAPDYRDRDEIWSTAADTHSVRFGLDDELSIPDQTHSYRGSAHGHSESVSETLKHSRETSQLLSTLVETLKEPLYKETGSTPSFSYLNLLIQSIERPDGTVDSTKIKQLRRSIRKMEDRELINTTKLKRALKAQEALDIIRAEQGTLENSLKRARRFIARQQETIQDLQRNNNILKAKIVETETKYAEKFKKRAKLHKRKLINLRQQLKSITRQRDELFEALKKLQPKSETEVSTAHSRLIDMVTSSPGGITLLSS